MLDALAKGFSVSEIIWDAKATPWKPAAYKFRDPRWFQYDAETGKTLMLRAPLGCELEPLKPLHFIVHEPHLISGSQITAGLALPALYCWMLKSYGVTSWAAFIDRYGYPIRIGKYGRKATEQDRATLKMAVAAIGQDFGAVIPESAALEIIEAKSTGAASSAYEKMADWIDRQISKLALGQTMTADAGASRAQSETHDKVRGDIADSDIRQIVETLNAALTAPYVKLNYGEQERYPKIDLHKPDVKNIEQIISALDRLGPQGLKARADELRSYLGLANPEDGDDVVGGRADGGSQGYASDGYGPELNAERGPGGELDRLAEDGGGWTAISDYIAAAIEKAADRATDFASFREELRGLVESWPADKIAECVAVATFKARAMGDAGFDSEQ